jgi:esterase/lipase
MKRIYFFFGFPFLLFSCITYNHKNPYPNMEILNYENAKAYEFKNISSDKLIINIEGSGWTSVLGQKGKNRWNYVGIGSQILQVLGNDYTIFIPEKWDRVPEIDYTWDFNSKINYTMNNLLECYLTSINNYLANNHYSSIILIGASEGAALLPIIYENIKGKYNVTGIVSLSFGGLSLYESYSILKDSPIVPDYYKVMIKYYFDMYETNNISAYTDESYILTLMGHKPFDYYVKINIPILFIHGVKDFNVSIESTKYIQENLPEKPFEYFYYNDMAHGPSNYFQTIRIRNDIAKWINNKNL